MGDSVDDARELRTLLKSAQNDAKRYAARVLHLQQELDRERLKTKDMRATASSRRRLGRDAVQLVADEPDVQAIDELQRDTIKIGNKLTRMIIDTSAGCALCECRHYHRTHARENSIKAPKEQEVTARLKELQVLLNKQRNQLDELAKENAQLRDQLTARPTHRDLTRSRWEVESLQAQIHRLKEEHRPVTADDGPDAFVDVYDPASTETATLHDRIGVDKLLSWLHVETKRESAQSLSRSSKRLERRRFLNEPVECYLVLDAAALEPTAPGTNAVQMTENEKMKKREQLSRRVGILCSEIVAACCHTVGVYDVGKLPRYVEATYQYAQLVPFLQSFVERIGSHIDSLATTKIERVKPSKTERYLDNLVERAQDLTHELQARREQMKPPGDKALSVAFDCMKLLRVGSINEITPSIQQLMESGRKDTLFLHGLRELIGLDAAAPRDKILEIVQQLLQTIGLSSPSPSRRRHGGNEASSRRP